MKAKGASYSKDETEKRFAAILHGAMHKPTLHKDVPKVRKAKPATKKRKQSA